MKNMNYFEKYAYSPESEAIDNKIKSVEAGLDGFASKEAYLKCFSLMDLTTLKTNDTKESVKKLVDKTNGIAASFPEFPLPASICVYPNFADVVRDCRTSKDVHVTTVSSCFPSAQSFPEVKVLECVCAVRNGAEEVDIVLALNSFLAGDFETASDEIKAMREAIDKEAAAQGRKVVLKVILETGLLGSAENIANASFLAMEAGADFIKTSTGKVDVNATPLAAVVMCECIMAFFKKTGRKVGFKAAGGISSAKDAVLYYGIVSTVLGSEWLNKDLFRLGVSRLGNALIGAVKGETVAYF